MLQSIVMNSSLEAQKITPSRCRARNCTRGFYFDPVTFDATITSTGALFLDPECSEKGDVEDVDEVSVVCCLCNMADFRSPRSIDCWSSYRIRLIKRLMVIRITQSGAVCGPFSGGLYNPAVAADH
jgi:hypothetical protein